MIIRRAAVIGDIHAEDDRLAAILDYCGPRGLDAVLCTGDIVDGSGDADRCARLLADARVICVRGNHDRWLVGGDQVETSRFLREFLASLPSTYVFDTSMGRALLCHGVGTNDMRRLTPDDFGYALTSNDELQELIRSKYSVVVGGHTHRSMVRRLGGLVFVNPGTLLRGLTDPPCPAAFAIIDFERGDVEMMAVDNDLVIRCVEKINLTA